MLKQTRTLKSLKATIWRWFDLILLAITAILLCVILQPALYAFENILDRLIDLWHWSISLAIGVLLSTIVWSIYKSLGGAFLRCSWWNPPIWLSAILPFIVYVLLDAYFRERDFVTISKDMGIALSIFAIGGVLSYIINVIFSKCEKRINHKEAKGGSGEALPDFEEISKDFGKLVEWIEKDEAINKPLDDRFQMAVFAKRIARILCGKPLKTIGLVGPYGCGKSSILNMAKDYIGNPSKTNNNVKTEKSEALYPSKRIILCFVSGWGFSEGTAAEHILQAAIKELSKHTDCVGLRNLPGHYRRAMTDSGSVLAKILAALLGAWESPLDVLRKLDAVLCRIGKRLVIILEDIDRNKRKDIYGEILSLLEGLKGLYNVSFVLAIGQESQLPEYQAIEVLIKASEHIEVVPNLPRMSVIKICETFRTPCLRMLDDKVKCVPDEDRDKRIGMRSYFLKGSLPYIDELAKNAIDYIAALLNNPRVLKLAFRRTWQAWKALCGEIEFDDLLMCNVLRAAAPEVFIFVNQNINVLRSFAPVPESEGGRKRNEKNREELQKELRESTERASYDSETAQKLIDVMFPGWADPAKSMYPSMREPLRRYQYVENSRPTDYWARLTREELSPKEVRDQEILFALDEWNRDRQQKVFRDMNMREAILSAKEVFDKVRQFKEFIDAKTLRALAQEQFQLTLEKDKNKASRENCPAVEEWALLRPEPPSLDSQKWRDWFYEQIKMAMPVSLRYVNDLYYSWVEPKRYSPLKLRSKIVEEAKRIYGRNPKALVRAIDPECFSVTHFAREYSESKQGGLGFNPEEWEWLGDALLAGAKIKRDIIVPQIVLLVGHIDIRPGKRTGTVHSYELGEDLAKGLFGKKIKQVMELIAEGVDLSNYDSEVRTYIKLAQNCAKKWLADQGDGGRPGTGRRHTKRKPLKKKVARNR